MTPNNKPLDSFLLQLSFIYSYIKLSEVAQFKCVCLLSPPLFITLINDCIPKVLQGF